jgi:hypothetical protein
MEEVRHCTSRKTLELILRDGLRTGSWVTTAHVEDLNPDQRVKALELDNEEKGQCACKLKIDRLTEPKQGLLTSSGYPQRKTPHLGKIVKADCRCESEIPWRALAIGGLLLGVLWLRGRR